MCADVLRDLIGPDDGITATANEVAARFGLGRVDRVAELPGAGARNALIETDSGSWVLRLGSEPATLGGRSRRLSTGVDVLRCERFFAAAIRDTTRLRSPWPYEIDAACDLLSVPYAVMPRLPGTSLWWSEERDWEAIGEGLAEAALDLHRPTWPAAGDWDPATDDITAFEQDHASRCRARVLGLIEQIAITSEPLDTDSRGWIADQLASIDAGSTADVSLIHGDFVIGNVCMTNDHGRWSVTGTFDFENSRIGDPEEDIVGHLWWACYGHRPEAAASFLHRYHRERPVSPRIYAYLVTNLLANWEYGRRKRYPWYGDARTFGEWAKPLHESFERVVTRVTTNANSLRFLWF